MAGRHDRDNVIDGYINDNEENICAEGIWQNYFTEQPERLTEGDKRAFAEPGGSIRDNLVIEERDRKDMVMAFTGMRLFHHQITNTRPPAAHPLPERENIRIAIADRLCHLCTQRP